MALGFSLLASHADTANQLSYSDVESTQPAANSALLLFVRTGKAGGGVVPASVTGYGATWTLEGSAIQGTGARLCVYSAYAGASPSASNFNVTAPSGGYTGCIFAVIQITGADSTDFLIQSVFANNTGQTSSSVTLAAFGDATNNGAVGATIIHVNSAITADATATWTNRVDIGHNSPIARMMVQTRTGQDTTVTSSWTGNEDWVAWAGEIKMASTTVLDEYAFASETDTAQPFFADSDKLDDYGFASETDTAQPFFADSNVFDEYAFATETDAAMPFDASSNVQDDYGFASESDSAMPFDASSNVLDEFGAADEADSAMPFSADTDLTDEYGFASETDEAMPFNADSDVLDEFGAADEADTAMPFDASSDVFDEYGLASETDEAMPFDTSVDLADEYGFAEETDAAMPFTATVLVLDEFGLASETDEAMPFAADAEVVDEFDFASETDAAMPFTASATSTDIEWDASSEGTATTGALSFTHTPVGDPAGIEVDVVVNASIADEITGVTYGGVALAKKADANEATGEPGRVQVWFLGTGIPTGPQTVVVSHTGSANAKWATCKSWIAPEDLVIVGAGNISDYGAAVSDATIPMWSLGNAVRSGALFTGLLDVSNPVPIAGMTADQNHDFGSTVAQSIYETAQSSGSTDFGWGDIADEAAVAAITITVASAVPVGTLDVEAISTYMGQPQGVADIIFTHPSPGTAGGVLIFTANLVSSAWITDIDYGGEAASFVVTADDTDTELWRVDEYNLLASVPTGDQIVTVNTANSPANAAEQFRTVTVITFATPVERITGAIDEENQANPQAALDTLSAPALRFGHIGSGHSAPTDLAAVNLPERIMGNEAGAQTVVTDFDPTPASGSVTVGWTATTEDVAAIYAAYGEPQDILDEFDLASETDEAMPFEAATDQTVLFGLADETDEAMPFDAASDVLDEYGLADETDEAMPFETEVGATPIEDLFGFAEETDTAMPFFAFAEEESPGSPESPGDDSPDVGSPTSPEESPVDSPIIDSPDVDSPDEPPFSPPDEPDDTFCPPHFMARRGRGRCC